MDNKLKDLKRKGSTVDCNDVTNQSLVMAYHQIGEDTFNAYVYSFFGKYPDEIKPKTYTADEIQAMVENTTVTCDYYIKIAESAPPNTTNNSNIYVEVDAPVHLAEIIEYDTMTLFRGFFNMNPAPDSFDFYKANILDPIGEIVGVAIIFRINAIDSTITYWDMSGSIPPISPTS